jgi:glycerophosphoryl diester phosphodiesterase
MKTIRNLIVGLLVVLGVVYIFMLVRARPVDNHPLFANQPHVLVIAHQGGEHVRPDNTMPAFQHAVDLGVDMLEMDIHRTSDGVLVIMHDETVDRTTDGKGLIKEMTFADLRELDAAYNWPHHDPEGDRPYRGQGVQVPALRELFEAFPDMPMNIEIKQTAPPIVQPFCDLLREYDMTDQVLVASFDPATLENFRQTCPDVATAGTEPDVRTFFILNTLFLSGAYSPPAEAFQVPEYSGDTQVLTRRFIQGAHQRNVEVHAWTIDEQEDMERLIALGIDGIITNRPDLLLDVLGR